MTEQRDGSDARSTLPIGRQTRDARLELFGVPARFATIELTPRPRRKRMTRALATIGGALVLALPVTLIPPHAPWLLGVLAVGAWRARSEWRGEYELHRFSGACPRCGGELQLQERYITPPLVVPCDACHSQPHLALAAPGQLR